MVLYKFGGLLFSVKGQHNFVPSSVLTQSGPRGAILMKNKAKAKWGRSKHFGGKAHQRINEEALTFLCYAKGAQNQKSPKILRLIWGKISANSKMHFEKSAKIVTKMENDLIQGFSAPIPNKLKTNFKRGFLWYIFTWKNWLFLKKKKKQIFRTTEFCRCSRDRPPWRAARVWRFSPPANPAANPEGRCAGRGEGCLQFYNSKNHSTAFREQNIAPNLIIPLDRNQNALPYMQSHEPTFVLFNFQRIPSFNRSYSEIYSKVKLPYFRSLKAITVPLGWSEPRRLAWPPARTTAATCPFAIAFRPERYENYPSPSQLLSFIMQTVVILTS